VGKIRASIGDKGSLVHVDEKRSVRDAKTCFYTAGQRRGPWKQ
jgi:hypothetical protein